MLSKIVDNIYVIFRFLAFAIIILIVILAILFYPTWPSKNKLCRELESAISFEECDNLDSRFEVLQTAFQIEKSSRKNVNDLLGDYYLSNSSTQEYIIEYYYIERHPIDYIFKFFKFDGTYSFTYRKTDDILIRIGYEAENW